MKVLINGDKLIEARYRSGMSKDELVRRSGVSSLTIYYAESGKVTPRATTLKKLCDALNIDMNEVIQVER